MQRPVPRLSFGTYNVHNLNPFTSRPDDVSATFSKVAILMLQGTQRRQFRKQRHHWESTARHRLLHFGYGSGPFTNKSAGCAIMVGRTSPR